MTSFAALLILLDLEALAALLWAFFTPSETGQGVFLWLSAPRLAQSTLLLMIFVSLVALTLYLVRVRASGEALGRRLDAWLVERRQLWPTMITLLLVQLSILGLIWLVETTPLEYSGYKTLAPETFPLLHSTVWALYPLLALVFLADASLFWFLDFRYRRALRRREMFEWSAIGPALVLPLAAVLTAGYWIVLAFRLRFFVNIPAWYWVFEVVPFGMGDVIFILAAAALLTLAWWLLFIKRLAAPGLLAAAALGLFLQFGVGLMGGQGLAALRDRYFTTYHAAYVQKAAASDLTLLDTIRQYEAIYGSNGFTKTKPPGLMVFYTALDHLINGYPSAFDNAVRYERLALLVVWLFPVLAVSMVGLLHRFARRFLEAESDLVPRLAPFLYVLAPSLALFTFFADQAVYPLVFLLGVWLTVLAIRTRSLPWALALGAFLYIAAFFAFTMLPLYVFTGLYLLLYHRREPGGPRLRQAALAAGAIAAGTLFLHFLSLTALNYNAIPRFQQTMAINHNFDFYLRVGQGPTGTTETLGVRFGQIAGAAWVNNLDFAAAIGFAFYILAVAQGLRRIAGFLKGRFSSGDIILMALIASFIIMNLAGTAQGEVPRLWLFWLPMFALLAACELQPLVQSRPYVLLALGLAQVITLMLTFHFQDLRM